ncbi:hypothetical protein GW17_00010589 [Ensete ventricosum]|nr:hypothetical protein GW17_00010589 [Ensete ventricosum]
MGAKKLHSSLLPFSIGEAGLMALRVHDAARIALRIHETDLFEVCYECGGLAVDVWITDPSRPVFIAGSDLPGNVPGLMFGLFHPMQNLNHERRLWLLGEAYVYGRQIILPVQVEFTVSFYSRSMPRDWRQGRSRGSHEKFMASVQTRGGYAGRVLCENPSEVCGGRAVSQWPRSPSQHPAGPMLASTHSSLQTPPRCSSSPLRDGLQLKQIKKKKLISGRGVVIVAFI